MLLDRVLVYGLYDGALFGGGKDGGCPGHHARLEDLGERNDTLVAVLNR